MENVDGKLYGKNLFGEAIQRKAAGPVAERFLFPPFSILDARQGEWQDRKRAWINMGINSEVGRDSPCNAAALCPLLGNRDRVFEF